MSQTPRHRATEEERQNATEALRFNTGKTRFDLVPHDALEAVAVHFTIGALKYAPRNWEKGFDWMSVYASMLRHLVAWAGGQDYDVGPNGEHGPYPDNPEIDMKWTGSPHIVCILWNAMVLTTFHLRNTGTDDRVVTLPNPKPNRMEEQK